MSRAALIAIMAGIIVAAIAVAVIATSIGGQPDESGMDQKATEGRQLTINLNENLSLKENP